MAVQQLSLASTRDSKDGDVWRMLDTLKDRSGGTGSVELLVLQHLMRAVQAEEGGHAVLSLLKVVFIYECCALIRRHQHRK